MLGALKFFPRHEVERHTQDEKSSRVRSKKRKYNDGAKDKSKSRERRKRRRSSDSEGMSSRGSSHESDRENEATTLEVKEDAKTRRKEAGLEWMLHAPERSLGVSAPKEDAQHNPTLDSEKPQPHAKELNPYIASGADENGQQRMHKTITNIIGDGGASWRAKALKRAREQAAREGRKLDEIVEERWDSLSTLRSSVTTNRPAPDRAHLHAIRDRMSGKHGETAKGVAKSGREFESSSSQLSDSDRRDHHREHNSRDSHREHSSRMKVPTVDLSLSWKRVKKLEMQPHTTADTSIGDVKAKSVKEYGRDSFSLRSSETEDQFKSKSKSKPVGNNLFLENLGGDRTDSFDVIYQPTRLIKIKDEALESNCGDEEETPQQKAADPPQNAADGKSVAGLSANQAAAKAMRLRLMGKVKEADEFLKYFEAGSRGVDSQRQCAHDLSSPPVQGERSRQVHRLDIQTAQNKLRAINQSCDAELAGSIARDKLYKGNVDDEYDDYGNGLETQRSPENSRSRKKLQENSTKQGSRNEIRQIVTRQEHCQYCFENTARPKHLVIAIANFSYLMLAPAISVVPFHCYIVPMQHEGSTRNVDESVWQELRNFKKCLVKMFGDQGKGVLFLETAVRLAQQRRHCFIECIPVPSDVAKDAPLYFKKAIDEAEDEWSQHNAKKLIDTRQKGLRNSIPKNFPYFHVEFGIQGGYCHVIDDESSFKPQFGLDVVAGMLEIPGGVSRHSRQDPIEQGRKVKEFLKDWDPFDWTKMLD